MKSKVTKVLTAVALTIPFTSSVQAEKIFCESPDKAFQFEVKENDPPAESAPWRIAHFNHPPRQRSIYTVYQTSRADKVLYVSEGNRKQARLELGTFNPNGSYPEAKLVTHVAGGGFLTTPMSCAMEGNIRFVNQCVDSRPETLGKKLIRAAREADIESVENLVDCGANVNYVSANGCNALLATLDPTCTGASDDWRPFPASQVTELANLLLDRGALMDSSEKRSGETTVHKAVRFGADQNDRDLLQLLIGLEASINAPDKSGKTPLMLAVLKEDVDSVQILVEGGSDIKLKDRSGKTAYDYARATGQKEAMNFLVEPAQVVAFQGSEEGKCSPENVTVKSGSLVRFNLKAIPDKMFKLDSPQLGIDLMAERGTTVYKNIRLDRKGEFSFTCGFHGGNSPTRGIIKVE